MKNVDLDVLHCTKVCLWQGPHSNFIFKFHVFSLSNHTFPLISNWFRCQSDFTDIYNFKEKLENFLAEITLPSPLESGNSQLGYTESHLFSLCLTLTKISEFPMFSLK